MPKANKKNLYLDRPSKSRGYMSGDDRTWDGEDAQTHIYNWYKQMKLSETNLRKYIRHIILENVFQGNEADKVLQAASDSIAQQGYQFAPEAIRTALAYFEAQADVDIEITKEYDFLEVASRSLKHVDMSRDTFPFQTRFQIMVEEDEDTWVLDSIHREISKHDGKPGWKLKSSHPGSSILLFIDILT